MPERRSCCSGRNSEKRALRPRSRSAGCASYVWIAMLLWPIAGWGQDPPAAEEPDGGAWHAALYYRRVLADTSSSVEHVARAVRAELALGRADRAGALLERHAGGELARHPQLLPLRAATAFAIGRWSEAGELFAAAAAAADREPAVRGLYAAQAADAFRAAGMDAPAAELYAAARHQLRPIAGWIALREARVVADTSHAFALLARAPVAARRLVSGARADVLLAAGDTVAAIPALAAAGDPGGAAWLALALGDTALARRLAYRALADADTAVVRAALRATEGPLAPRSVEELKLAGQAHRRFGAVPQAARLVRQAVAQGDTSAATLRLLGELLSEDGQRAAALEAYAWAAEAAGADAALATYLRARLLVRMGRRAEGEATLLAFADGFPAHEHAALAVYLVAEARRGAGHGGVADSLYRSVVARWPGDLYASRARSALATSSLARGDSAAALAWYRAEVDMRGAERHAARYAIARIRAARGESRAAMAEWRELAAGDPIGYYGTMARQAAGMPLPAFSEGPPPVGGPEVERTLAGLDLLQRLGWAEEARELVRHALAHAPGAPEELLALGDGFIQRGWVSEGVTLGWRAAGALSLSDARVLRVVFPWPMRALIEAEATKHGLDPFLVAGLIRQESTFRPAVVSRAGATGLMQLMPGTASGLARRLRIEWDDRLLAVADANLHLGAAYLASLLRQYGGSEVLALAAYNAGGRPVERWRRDADAGDAFRFVERIPYDETRGYVRSVLRNRELYRALYSAEAQRPGGAR